MMYNNNIYSNEHYYSLIETLYNVIKIINFSMSRCLYMSYPIGTYTIMIYINTQISHMKCSPYSL